MGSWNKYHAKKEIIDGITFMSKMEAKRYIDLKMMQKGKIIEGLICQPKFKAIINGTKICDIILDFQYFDKEKNTLVYEDVKGFDTPISKLKRKLLKALYPNVDVLLVSSR